MEKTLYVTDGVPTNAKILLVDMQKFYFQDTDYVSNEVVASNVDDRMNEMEIELIELRKKGHKIYAIIDENYGPIISELRGIPHMYLPFWGVSDGRLVTATENDPANMYELEPKIIEAFDKDDVILVCGLWKELCAFAVTRLLQKEGFNAILSTNPKLCLENAIVWEDDDVITLESECLAAGVTIQSIDVKGEEQ